MFFAAASVCAKSAATVSSASEPATWPTTSALRSRCRSRLSDCERPPSCNAPRASARDARQAGQRLIAIPVTMVAINE